MLKSSTWIKTQAEQKQLINPFVPHSEREGVISFGLGPYGYDLRLDTTYKITKSDTSLLDPHQMKEDQFNTISENKILLSPGTSILAKTVEYLVMPKKVLGLVFGKSTYARCGILINVTPIEPEWSGFITMAIANVSNTKVALYPNEGIAQILFFESDQLPLYSYKELKGKYNDQKDITIAKI